MIADVDLKTGIVAAVARKHAEARQYEQALQVANSIADTTAKARVLAEIAHQQIEAGDKGKALDLLSQVPQNWPELARKYLSIGQYDRALQIAHAITDPSVKIKVIVDIVRNRVEAEQYQQAFQIAAGITDTAIKARLVAEIVRNRVKAGQYEEAIRMTSSIEDEPTKAKMLAEIARKEAEAGHCEQAGQIANSIADPELRTDIFNEIIRSYATAGQCEQALRVATEMATPAGKVRALTQIVRECKGREDREQKVKEMLSRALELAGTVQDVSSREKVLAEIARRHAEEGQYEQAFHVAGTLEDASFKREALTDIAGKEFIRQDREVELTAQAAEFLSQTNKLWQGVRAHDWQLAEAALKYAEAEQGDRALEVAGAMEAVVPQASTLIEIADRWVEKGHQEKAAESLSRALAVANTLGSAQVKGQVLAAVGLLYAKIGQGVDEGAKQTLHEMIAKLGDKGRRR
jgi:tetratricopeptide (TPR) repeat protein